jgi:MFS family permease
MYLGIMFFPFFITVIAHAIVETGRFPWSWPWFFASLLLVVERVWTVRAGGPRALILAILVLPEIVYDMIQHYVFLRAGVDELVRSDEHWDHAEAQNSRGRRWWPVLLIPTAIMLACLAAVLCIQLGIQWVVIGVIVASGIAHACLRATPLDPLVLVYGSYQLAH